MNINKADQLKIIRDRAGKTGICGKMLSVTVLVLLTVLLFSCRRGKNKAGDERDTPQQGTIHISVDETFEPVIREEIKIYQLTYPDAHIEASYKSEADCFRDLEQDKTRMIIVARGLSAAEVDYYTSKLTYRPPFEIMAWDAVSVLVNNQSADSIYTVEQLKSLLSSSAANDKKLIVDGNNATSTVRYLMDSIMKGTPFGKNVQAAKNSQQVLDYIVANPNAIGFVGSSWIGDGEDPVQAAYLQKLRPALIKCKICNDGTYARPSQQTISTMQYPLYRPVVAIVKENYLGLGSGFYNFMGLERGQLVFRRALLVPARMSFQYRQMNVSTK